jgi:hypothetical protein
MEAEGSSSLGKKIVPKVGQLTKISVSQQHKISANPIIYILVQLHKQDFIIQS